MHRLCFTGLLALLLLPSADASVAVTHMTARQF